MSNKKEILKIIKERIKLNISKVEIEKELVSKYKVEEFTKILADLPEPELKQKYKTHNIVLVVFFAVAIVFKLFSILEMESEFGEISVLFFLLIALIIPVILIKGILSFRKNAYGLTAAVCIFSLLPFLKDPGEFAYVSSTLVFIMIVVILFLSLFLRKKIYPKNIIINEPA